MRWSCLLLLTLNCWAQTPAAAVGAVLDDWHRAAAASDADKYFGRFASNGVFMGTDATERWTVNEFREWAKPQFEKHAAWDFKPRDRHIDFSSDGKVAWFDEILDIGRSRIWHGSGVMVLEGGAWKVAQYNLSVPVPNSILGDVMKKISEAAK